VPSAPSPGCNAQLSLALSLSLSYSYTLSYALVLGLAHILKCVCRECVCFGLRALLVPRSPLSFLLNEKRNRRGRGAPCAL
jgi:hypothetical protein